MDEHMKRKMLTSYKVSDFRSFKLHESNLPTDRIRGNHRETDAAVLLSSLCFTLSRKLKLRQMLIIFNVAFNNIFSLKVTLKFTGMQLELNFNIKR